MAYKPLPLDLPPGVLKGESKLASVGRFIDCDNVRWVNRRPEKIGGYEALTSTPLVGKARGIHTWGDNSGLQYIGVGTAYGLYEIPNNTYVPVDITPFQSVVVKTNPFSTTNASASVSVAYAGHGLAVGQLVNFTGASAVGGLTITGNYLVTTVGGTDVFTITAAGPASSTAGPGGGSVTVSIELADGAEDVSSGFGYGIGGYGEGTWGTARDLSTLVLLPRSWSLANFGQLLLANPVGGGVYEWDPAAIPAQARAELVADAPTVCNYVFVTSERTVFALGTDSDGDEDKMLMHWSGQGAYDDWDVVALASTAGGRPSGTRRLQMGSRIVAGCDLGSLLNLVWTDAALYLNQFTGNQFTYNTRLVGEKCGLIGPMAFAKVGGVAYWLGNEAFWLYNGSVQKMPNSEQISEWLFKQLRLYYSVKTIAWHNARYGEIWFGIVLEGQTEPTLAAVYNLKDGFWFPCTIDRTAATSFNGDNTRPIMAGTDGLMYRHDVGVDGDGAALDWHLETSVLEIADGAVVPTIFGIGLDMERQVGDVTVTLTGYDRSNASVEVDDTETHDIAPDVGIEDFHCSARLLQMRLSGSGVGCDFRMGIPKAFINTSSRARE